MGVNADNFSTYPEESAENISALGQLLDNHNKDGDAHSEQFDLLASEIKKVGKALEENVRGVLDAEKAVGEARTDVLGARDDIASAAADVRKSADDIEKVSDEVDKVKSEVNVAKGTVQELVKVAGEKVDYCEGVVKRVAQMASDVESDKDAASGLKSSAENFAKVSKEKAEESADSAQLAKNHADRAEAAANVAKSVHPKIVNGMWWVYDADKGEMVSSGIKAEGVDGYTPVRGVDYWTSADRERMKNEVASVVTPVVIGDVWHVYDSETGSVVSTGVTAVAKDGYTPRKGIDYFDGYTPQKGVDYFDGAPGKDGYTPQKGVDYFDGEKGDPGDTPQKGIDYFDGAPGKDGYTPQKGIDYYTETEKEEFVGEVLRESDFKYANALKGNASGNFVSITDISPIEHNLGVKVSGKNLFNPEAEVQKVPSEYYTGIEITNLVKKGLPLYLSMKLKDGKTFPDASYFGVVWNIGSAVSATWYIQSREQKITSAKLIIPATAERIGISAMSQAHWNAIMDAFDIQLEIGTTATEYTPYVKPEDVRVSVFGKNLIPYPFYDSFTKSTKGITATDLGDGGVLLNGTATSDAYINLHLTNIGYHYIYGNQGVNGKFYANKYNDNIGVNHDGKNHLTYIWIKSGTTCNNVVFYPQIEVGPECTEFEKGLPYRSFKPNTDGTVDDVASVAPYMNVFCNNKDVTLDVTYNKDVNKVIENLTNAIISLGGNV